MCILIGSPTCQSDSLGACTGTVKSRHVCGAPDIINMGLLTLVCATCVCVCVCVCLCVYLYLYVHVHMCVSMVCVCVCVCVSVCVLGSVWLVSLIFVCYLLIHTISQE